MAVGIDEVGVALRAERHRAGGITERLGRGLMWRLVGARATGTSHVDRDQPCQDYFCADIASAADGDEYLLAVIADGAGSAVEGAEGSRLVCETVMQGMRDAISASEPALDAEAVRFWLHWARVAIEEKAQADGLCARDFACTILGAVVGPTETLFFQIGDGAIVAFTEAGATGVVFWPDGGEYVNATYFVTEEDAFANLHFATTERRIHEVAIFTDGLQRLALSFATRTPHPPFFDPMLSTLRREPPGRSAELQRTLARFLDSEAVNSRTDDDKTLVLATRIPASE
jgi:hypothetical protein